MSKLTWSHNGKNTDGSDFDPTRFHGWDLRINGTSVLSVPVGWEVDGTYEAEIGDIKQGLSEGHHAVTMRLVAKQGFESSDPSPPFTLTVAPRKPTPPFGVAVS